MLVSLVCEIRANLLYRGLIRNISDCAAGTMTAASAVARAGETD